MASFWIRFATQEDLQKALSIVEDVPGAILALPGREWVALDVHLAALRAAKVKFSILPPVSSDKPA